jgi:hypothetical protein
MPTKKNAAVINATYPVVDSAISAVVQLAVTFRYTRYTVTAASAAA